MIKMIISGGQSGADLAGNIFARASGIDTEIRTFQGFKPNRPADQLVYESFRKYYIPKITGVSYVQSLRDRTEHNVLNSDGTIIFIHSTIERTRGSLLTFGLCKRHVKPFVVISEHVMRNLSLDKLADWLTTYKPYILNIAGERDMKREFVISMLEDAFERVKYHPTGS